MGRVVIQEKIISKRSRDTVRLNKQLQAARDHNYETGVEKLSTIDTFVLLTYVIVQNTGIY
jgi:hypothetical protein